VPRRVAVDQRGKRLIIITLRTRLPSSQSWFVSAMDLDSCAAGSQPERCPRVQGDTDHRA